MNNISTMVLSHLKEHDGRVYYLAQLGRKFGVDSAVMKTIVLDLIGKCGRRVHLDRDLVRYTEKVEPELCRAPVAREFKELKLPVGFGDRRHELYEDGFHLKTSGAARPAFGDAVARAVHAAARTSRPQE